eukprot:s295_g20.t1
MSGDHDIEVANQSMVGIYKKDIKNILGCEITPDAHKVKDEDALSGKFRYGTTILITVLQFTVATSSGSHNFVMGLQDMGSENIINFKIQDAEGETGMNRLMDAPERVLKYLKDNPAIVNVTIHVWLSMSFVINPLPPYILLAEANFHVSFRFAIQDLEEKCLRLVFVAICPDSNFNQVAGQTDEVARRLTAELRKHGILVSSSENMWRMMCSQFGHQYKTLRKSPEGSAGKTAIWAAIEKTLFRQRVFLMCSSDRDAADLLNTVAHQPEKSGIKMDRLKTITAPLFLFRTPESTNEAKNREEEYWRGVGEEGEIGASTCRKVRKKSKAKWMDVKTANLELDPRHASGAYWLPVNMRNNVDLLCTKCRGAETFADLESVEVDPRFCINCSANNQSQNKRTGPELQESQALIILASRLKVALKNTGAGLQDPRIGFKDWLINVAASFVANHGLGYGEKLMKAVSHMGGVRVQVEQLTEIFRNGRGKQFSVYRAFIPFSATRKEGVVSALQDGIVAYRLMKDCGNVMYKDFLTKSIDDDNKMNEIFGPTKATAEKAGDVVEFWFGLLDVASMTKGTANVFPDDLDPAPFLNGLEAAVRFFRQTARSTSTISDKRKGSFDCTLDAREMDEVNAIIHGIKNFRDLDDFHYLTDEELAEVIQRYEIHIEQVNIETTNQDDVDVKDLDTAMPETTEKMSTEKTVPPEQGDVKADAEVEEEKEAEAQPEHMYERPLFMSQVGDQDEYGSYCIDGYLLAQSGPRTEDDITNIVKDALLKGGGDRWS